MEHDPVEVDQVLLQQRVEELRAAGEKQVPAGLLLELSHRFHRVPLEQLRAGPLGLVQGRRDHVLGDAVHPLAELAGAFHGGPGRREALVGLPAHEERIAGLQLAPLELAGFLTEEGEGPMAGLLADAVER